MKITITQDHLERALKAAKEWRAQKPFKGYYSAICLVAQAVSDAGYVVDRISFEKIYLKDGHEAVLPKNIRYLIRDFDALESKTNNPDACKCGKCINDEIFDQENLKIPQLPAEFELSYPE
jgi:hypothetical protein